ncbi:serine/threonine protein phosphatase [Paenibacillus sp. 7541]|uniref:Serine/threonine protein phosphatase n=2 Tax=Paenibacillus TaxID=44249 RepID=A0A268EJI4_9BACL|nr:serine/threonine protein phosphatase [Paenibacillus campinasensis]PAK49388.1 serine/threonine protein phosphatase [Paenibacillus sp. 7541]
MTEVYMRKENSEFETGFVSEAGSFIDNRDYFAYIETEDLACYVLADGLDTVTDMNSAEMAVKAVLENFMEKPSMSRRRLMRGLRDAHEWLQFESRRVRLKASLLVIVTDYTRMVYASVGNVRLYHFRGGRLNFRSRDHSLAQSLVDDGRIPEDAAHLHEERGNLLEYLGKPGKLQAYVSKKTMLADGDVLLMVTPGMWEEVELAEMLGALEESKDPVILTDTLEEVLLSRQRRIIPNYTAAAISVKKIYQEKPKNRAKLIKRILIALIVMLLIGGGTWITLARSAEKKAQAVQEIMESGSLGDEYARLGDFQKAISPYSEAKNAATRIKDLVNRKLYLNKQALSQAIVDGDGYVDEGDFENAKISYEKALSLAKTYLSSSVDTIEKRIQDLDGYEAIRKQITEADVKFRAGDYTDALKLYEQAYKKATEGGYDRVIQEISGKQSDTQDKLTAIEHELQGIRAGKLAARGERLLQSEEYSGAIDAYAEAQQIYQEIGKLESVLSMERAITKVEDKQRSKQDEERAALAQQQEASDLGAIQQGPAGQAGSQQAAADQAAAQQAAIEQAARMAAEAAIREQTKQTEQNKQTEQTEQKKQTKEPAENGSEDNSDGNEAEASDSESQE